MKKSKLRKDQFSWITGDKLLEIAACVDGCGEGAIVEVHDGTYEDGTPAVMFKVQRKGGGLVQTFNESFPCPPFCPPD